MGQLNKTKQGSCRVGTSAAHSRTGRDIFFYLNFSRFAVYTVVCRFTFGAPVILVVGYDRTRDWKNKLMPGLTSGETDAAIVCTHMMLQAFELGIGSCWVGYFNPQVVAETLGLPENVTVSALLPMGYPAEDAKPLPLHEQVREFADTITVI